jgi:hypothetical protein
LNPSVTFRHPNLPNLTYNILVDNNGHACLAGFSLLTMASDELTATSSFIDGGTTRWMSPELFYPEEFGMQEGRPTKASDCYALGMVMYEVLSGQLPFADYKNPYVIPLKIVEGNRPGRPQGKEGELFTDEIWDILELCWKPQPRDRISASAVLLRLGEHPSPPMPSSNIDGDAKTGSSSQWKSGSDGQSYSSDHDQPDTDSSMFSPSYPGPIFNHPCATVEPQIVRGHELPLPQRTIDPEEVRFGPGWDAYRNKHLDINLGVDEPDDIPPAYTPYQ